MTARRNGSGKIRENATKRDNHSIPHKVHLRRTATKELASVNVLDLFAGRGELWSRLDPDTYQGIEVENGKNPNAIVGDNRLIIPKLDLSRYNVIDCDSYGVPADQIRLLYENKTLQKGTVLIYTCISNKVSTIPKTLQDYAGFRGKMYQKAQTLFNGWAVELFFDYLASLGVSSVFEYEETREHGYTKKYGYFIV